MFKIAILCILLFLNFMLIKYVFDAKNIKQTFDLKQWPLYILVSFNIIFFALFFHISAFGINMKLLLIVLLMFIGGSILTGKKKQKFLCCLFVLYVIESIFLVFSLIMLKFLVYSNMFVSCGIGLSGLLITIYISNNLAKNLISKKIFQWLLYIVMFCSTALIFSVIMKFIIF